jgi:5-methyltetrahydropteroyltriglutamate--homocysteine methyltransferase
MSEAGPPFRADHVGSLLRPLHLLRAREKFENRTIDAPQLRAIENAAIAEVVRRQEDIGLESITDGEFRRRSFHLDFFYRLGGVSRAENENRITFHSADGDVDFATPGVQVTERVKLRETVFADDFEFLKDVTKQTPKITIPAPSLMHLRGGQGARNHAVYPDIEEFWQDVGEAYAEQVQRLGALGCTYLQLDDTSFAGLGDVERRNSILKVGGDPEKQHLTYINVNNAALARKPEGMSVVIHTCRGNFRSGWLASGGYEFAAEALFNNLNVQGFFLEYDDDRSGGFEPLRFVPKGKKVVLGLVTSKRGTLESKDTLKRRIDEASRYIALDQLCISPQCGFASTVEGNAITAEEQWAKLSLIVETAKEVWG